MLLNNYLHILLYYTWKRDETALTSASANKNFHVNNNGSVSCNLKQKISGKTANGGIKDVEIMVPLKYLSNFWRTLEMPLISCEIILIFTWSENRVVVCTDVANQGAIFAITETTLFVPLATLSTLWLRGGGILINQ